MREAATVRMIPVSQIVVLNPRVRGKRSFTEISENIAEVGLKKPITVTEQHGPGGPQYTLVCGQGRLEAYQSLGQTLIPALIDTGDEADSLVKSLVENCARRRHSAIELFADIERMKKRGYTMQDIARKTGLNYHYVRDLFQLLTNGERRLVRAVNAGQIPISIAVVIANSSEKVVQEALQQAYDDKKLRGSALLAVRKLIEQRRRLGKGCQSRDTQRSSELTPNALLRTYKKEVDRKRVLVHKASVTRDRLTFIIQAFRTLFNDEDFVNLLRAEGLSSLPRNVADRLTDGAPKA